MEERRFEDRSDDKDVIGQSAQAARGCCPRAEQNRHTAEAFQAAIAVAPLGRTAGLPSASTSGRANTAATQYRPLGSKPDRARCRRYTLVVDHGNLGSESGSQCKRWRSVASLRPNGEPCPWRACVNKRPPSQPPISLRDTCPRVSRNQPSQQHRDGLKILLPTLHPPPGGGWRLQAKAPKTLSATSAFWRRDGPDVIVTQIRTRSSGSGRHALAELGRRRRKRSPPQTSMACTCI